MHWTERGLDYASPDYLTDWTKMGTTFNVCAAQPVRIDYGLESRTQRNEKGQPNIGPFPCAAVVTIHSRTTEITRGGHFWALAQFSRFIRRGARRFDSQGTIPDLDHVGLENPGQPTNTRVEQRRRRPQHDSAIGHPGCGCELEERLHDHAGLELSCGS
jgi:glucosylceramidase